MTGAGGFVGRALCTALHARGKHVVAVTRRSIAGLPVGVNTSLIHGMHDRVALATALDGADVVVHLAARVHVTREDTPDQLTAFREVNVAGSLSLGRHAVEAGVKRFVFISSVKVNGDATPAGHPFSEGDLPAPSDPYGVSKMEAELGLMELAASTGLEVVVIRPPLVYGPGVQANFAALMHAVARGVPLPLGAVKNRRSLAAIDNLVDLICTCLDHPAAANQAFFVSNGEDLSTPELIRRLAVALGRPAHLFPVPVSVLRAGAKLLRRTGVAQQLCGSLQVDITKARDLLGWTPPVTTDEGLRRTVRPLAAGAT